MLELMPPFYFLTFAKVSVSVSKKFGLKKVSVSVSKTFGLEKKSRYRSQKIWSRKKVSVSVSMKFFGLVTQCDRLPLNQYPVDPIFPSSSLIAQCDENGEKKRKR